MEAEAEAAVYRETKYGAPFCVRSSSHSACLTSAAPLGAADGAGLALPAAAAAVGAPDFDGAAAGLAYARNTRQRDKQVGWRRGEIDGELWSGRSPSRPPWPVRQQQNAQNDGRQCTAQTGSAAKSLGPETVLGPDLNSFLKPS